MDCQWSRRCQTTWEQAKNNAANSGADAESQLQNRGSLLEHYRQLISLRNEVPALRDGGIREYSSGNSGIMAFERITAGEQVLVVHNLTGGTQNISLHPGTNTVTYSSISRRSGEKRILRATCLHRLLIPQLFWSKHWRCLQHPLIESRAYLRFRNRNGNHPVLRGFAAHTQQPAAGGIFNEKGMLELTLLFAA